MVSPGSQPRRDFIPTVQESTPPVRQSGPAPFFYNPNQLAMMFLCISEVPE